MRFPILRVLATLLLLSFISCWPAQAQSGATWFYPTVQRPQIVNPYLTPERILQGGNNGAWKGQTVLWEGRVRQHDFADNIDTLTIATAAGPVQAVFKKPAHTLKFSRQGYRVAIKGTLNFTKDKFTHLSGQSAILLEAPLDYSYDQWLCGASASLSDFFAWRIQFHNPNMPIPRCQQLGQAFIAEAQRNHLDPLYWGALLQIESAWNPQAVSTSGAMGLGQLMPRTAQGLGVQNAFDPLQNLRGSGAMVGRLYKSWDHNPLQKSAVLASYNAGPTLVRSLQGHTPDIPETQNYVYFIGYLNRDLQRLCQRYHLH